MNWIWIKDPKTGKRSVTVSLLFWGFLLASFKLLFSGIEITEGWKMSEFGGDDFAMVLAAAAGIYGWRKHQENGNVKKEEAAYAKKSKDGSKPPVEGAN